jgi:hypothetical protein
VVDKADVVDRVYDLTDFTLVGVFVVYVRLEVLLQARVLLWQHLKLLLQLLHVLLLLVQIHGQLSQPRLFPCPDLFSLLIDQSLALLQVQTFLFEVQEALTQLVNVIFSWVLTIVGPVLPMLTHFNQEISILLKRLLLVLALLVFEFSVSDLRLQLFDRVLVLQSLRLVLVQICLLRLALVLIAHKCSIVVLDDLDLSLLHLQKAILLLVKLLGLLDDFFFLLVETVINLSLLSFFLQKSDSLEGSLWLNNKRTNFVQVLIAELFALGFRCFVLNERE